MKLLLLIAVIHVLVFHQNAKDKNEMLAPGNSMEKKKSLYDDNYLSRRVTPVTDTIPVVEPPQSDSYYFGSYGY